LYDDNINARFPIHLHAPHLVRRNKLCIVKSVSSTTSVDSNPRTTCAGFFYPKFGELSPGATVLVSITSRIAHLPYPAARFAIVVQPGTDEAQNNVLDRHCCNATMANLECYRYSP
jgi:hypothetical protein